MRNVQLAASAPATLETLASPSCLARNARVDCFARLGVHVPVDLVDSRLPDWKSQPEWQTAKCPTIFSTLSAGHSYHDNISPGWLQIDAAAAFVEEDAI